MNIKFPFPRWNQQTPVRVYHTELSEDGEPVEEVLYTGRCFYDEKMRHVMDAERRLITLSGLIVIEGDIRPGKIIEGHIGIGYLIHQGGSWLETLSAWEDTGMQWNGDILVETKKIIHRVKRPKNPDGSVFSTELELS